MESDIPPFAREWAGIVQRPSVLPKGCEDWVQDISPAECVFVLYKEEGGKPKFVIPPKCTRCAVAKTTCSRIPPCIRCRGFKGRTCETSSPEPVSFKQASRTKRLQSRSGAKKHRQTDRNVLPLKAEDTADAKSLLEDGIAGCGEKRKKRKLDNSVSTELSTTRKKKKNRGRDSESQVSYAKTLPEHYRQSSMHSALDDPSSQNPALHSNDIQPTVTMANRSIPSIVGVRRMKAEESPSIEQDSMMAMENTYSDLDRG